MPESIMSNDEQLHANKGTRFSQRNQPTNAEARRHTGLPLIAIHPYINGIGKSGLFVLLMFIYDALLAQHTGFDFLANNKDYASFYSLVGSMFVSLWGIVLAVMALTVSFVQNPQSKFMKNFVSQGDHRAIIRALSDTSSFSAAMSVLSIVLFFVGVNDGNKIDSLFGWVAFYIYGVAATMCFGFMFEAVYWMKILMIGDMKDPFGTKGE